MRTTARVERLRERLAAENLPALLISHAENLPSENVRYLSGFTGSTGYLLLTADVARLLTDFRYVEQAGRQAQGFEVVQIQGKLPPALVEQVRGLGLRQLAFESERVTVATHQDLLEALREAGLEVELKPVRGLVEGLRAVKEPRELEALRRAVLVADRAFEEVAATLRPGLTEREVAWRLEMAMRRRGADGPSFDIIVAAGPNGAMPHHRPGNRPLALGEPIVIDMGARLDGYCSDMTRTVVLGTPPSRFWSIYETVLRAQQTCERGLKAGLNGVQGDALARDVIAAAGHGDHFGHGTGHGVGMAVHEPPRLSPWADETPLESGMVVTVEPGIYEPEWGGVRIEDMVVIGQAGVEVLTTAHKQPVVEGGEDQ